MATKVKLRAKNISGNRQSLYLDFYPAIPNPETGEPTRRQFLGKYIFGKLDKDGELDKIAKKKLSPLDQIEDDNTLKVAKQLRQNRDNEISKPEIYTVQETEQLRISKKNKDQAAQSFVSYFKTLAYDRAGTNFDNWISAYKHLHKHTNGKLTFADLDMKFCNEFKKYLLTTKSGRSSKTTLSQNTAASYFIKFRTAIKQAYKDGILQTDLNIKLDNVKVAETHRNFLTIEELNSLVKTECFNPMMKRAALFSALTGLRFSDIQKMVWGELEFIEGNGYFVKFKQQKTKGAEMMPISKQASELLGERKAPTDKIFEGLTYSAYQNKHLAKWIGLAGITKDITFHCFRHSFATLQLSNGTDIYTLSKMLGHRNLKTTQIYAKIIDQTKREAADKIKLNF